MIYDRLNNYKQYLAFNPKLEKAFNFLLNMDFASLDDGSYEIDGKEIYANVQSLITKEVSDKKWEVHRKYIDIQYLISGQEKIGYGILEDFKEITIPYNEEKDVEFLDGEKYNFVNLNANDFVIFFDNDVHAPMLACDKPMNIKKVIVKIAI